MYFCGKYRVVKGSDSYISGKLPWVAAVCTVFVTYPNAVWIPWNLERLAEGEEPGFWAFFLFRMLWFYGLFYFQLRHNLRRIGNVSFVRRFGMNFMFTLAGCAVFVALSYGLPLAGIQTGYVGNILLFQFFVVCLLCTFIGYISVLEECRREKEKEIERLRSENLQSRCDALTNQINPHFFFNSLGGIQSLVRKKNDEETLLYVGMLSDIFRYILQSDRKRLVALSEELEFIDAFRYVMEVRFRGKLSFAIDVSEDSRKLRLPVLSLLPLVENIAVHNMIDSEHLMRISIRSTRRDELEISNPIYPKLSPPDTNGTGLQNLGNRFRLMMHKNIRIETDGATFSVTLPLTDESCEC